MNSQFGRPPVEPDRSRGINKVAIPLGLGSVLLGLLTALAVVVLLVRSVSEFPLLAMTVGLHAGLVICAVFSGFIVIRISTASAKGYLSARMAGAIHRNLIVLWLLGLFVASLGWITLALALGTGQSAPGATVLLLGLAPSAVLVAYSGLVVVAVRRLLR